MGRFHRAVGDFRLHALGGAGLQGGEDAFLFASGQFTAGQVMVIHPGLTEGDNLGMTGQRGEFLEEVHGTGIEHIAGVQPDHRKDVIVFLRDGNRFTATLATDADGDDAVHTGFAGAGDDGVELPLKLREIKMSVSVGEHGHYQRTTDEAQVKPPPKTTMRM